jgi:hypothetical protein
MLELATLKTAVDLFKGLIEILDRGRLNRQRVFKELIQPLFESLEPITNEYYEIIAEARTSLSAESPDLGAVLLRIEERRDKIIMARSKIFGMAFAYFREQNEKVPRRDSDFKQKTRELITKITVYFSNRNDDDPDAESPARASKAMFLANEIRNAIRNKAHDPDIPGLRYVAELALKRLERDWRGISEVYAELKILSSE